MSKDNSERPRIRYKPGHPEKTHGGPRNGSGRKKKPEAEVNAAKVATAAEAAATAATIPLDEDVLALARRYAPLMVKVLIKIAAEGVVEGDAFFEPGNAAKILVIGAVEVIDRGINQSKPRRKHAKYLDTRSGRLRLAMIGDNTAGSIEAFVRANVKAGTTLLTDGHASYPGLTDYRHDPRVVGNMAGHVVLPWMHRAFSLLKRWGLGTYHGLRRKHVDTYLNEFVFRYNRR